MQEQQIDQSVSDYGIVKIDTCDSGKLKVYFEFLDCPVTMNKQFFDHIITTQNLASGNDATIN